MSNLSRPAPADHSDGWIPPPLFYVAIFLVGLFLVIGITPRAQAQPCTPESALAVGTEWTEGSPDLAFANDVAPSGSQAAILERIKPIAAMFREAYPEPRGTAAAGYASIRRNGDEIDGGPVPYGYTSLYKTWLCPSSTGQLELAGETGNWAYVYVNGLHLLLSEVGEMTIDDERSMVWALARRIGDLRGETLYEAWAGLSYGRALLFTRPGMVPWKPVTQKQYLDALALYWQEGSSATANAMDEAERAFEEQLAEVKRTMTGEMRDQLVAEMERALADIRAQRPRSDNRLAEGVAEEIKYIQDYQAAHSEQEMQQPAFVPEGVMPAFRGEFWKESQGGHLLVRVDPVYFRQDLPREAAQLVMLLWRWEHDSAASDRWRTTFECGFPLDRLRALIDR